MNERGRGRKQTQLAQQGTVRALFAVALLLQGEKNCNSRQLTAHAAHRNNNLNSNRQQQQIVAATTLL